MVVNKAGQSNDDATQARGSEQEAVTILAVVCYSASIINDGACTSSHNFT